MSQYNDLFDSVDTTSAATPSPNSVSVSDHLIEDPEPLPGQRYVLLSFADPKPSTQEKLDQFINQRFLRWFYTQSMFHNVVGWMKKELHEVMPEEQFNKVVQQMDDKLTASMLQQRMTTDLESASEKDIVFSLQTLMQRYQDYRALHYEDDVKAFREQLGTDELVVQGVKFRGAFGTIEEASERAQYLRRMRVEPYIDVFASEGFKWVPRNPNPFAAGVQVDYGTGSKDPSKDMAQLNRLMQTFKLQDQERREKFEQRKRLQQEHAQASLAAAAASSQLFRPDNSVHGVVVVDDGGDEKEIQ